MCGLGSPRCSRLPLVRILTPALLTPNHPVGGVLLSINPVSTCTPTLRDTMLTFCRPSLRTLSRRIPAARTFSKAAASSEASGKTLSVDVRDDGIAVVTFNDPNQSVNTLTKDLIVEFDETLTTIQNDSRIKAWVLTSSKPGCFIAGADINMMNDAESAAEVEAIVADGHKLFDRLSSGKPVVAAIDGVCFGGGLEVALACNYRIASTGPKTALSLPEVKLGLLPGGGGTQRLPKVVGLVEALTMATTGGNVKPKKAKRTGLVDQVADPYALQDAAIAAAHGLVSGKVKSVRKKNLMARIMEDTPVKNIVFKKTREKIQKLTKGKYPAPFAIVDCIEAGLKSPAAGFELEKKEFARLSQTPESKALMGLYFGTVQVCFAACRSSCMVTTLATCVCAAHLKPRLLCFLCVVDFFAAQEEPLREAGEPCEEHHRSWCWTHGRGHRRSFRQVVQRGPEGQLLRRVRASYGRATWRAGSRNPCWQLTCFRAL